MNPHPFRKKKQINKTWRKKNLISHHGNIKKGEGQRNRIAYASTNEVQGVGAAQV